VEDPKDRTHHGILRYACRSGYGGPRLIRPHQKSPAQYRSPDDGRASRIMSGLQKGNRCRLRQVAAELGIGETRLYAIAQCQSF